MNTSCLMNSEQPPSLSSLWHLVPTSVFYYNPHSQEIPLLPPSSCTCQLWRAHCSLSSTLSAAAAPAASGLVLVQFHVVSVLFLAVTGHLLGLSNCPQQHKTQSFLTTSLILSLVPSLYRWLWSGHYAGHEKYSCEPNISLTPVLVEPRI